MARGIWWLASYPKSGNTWLRAAIATLVSGRPVDINAMNFLGATACARFPFDDALGIDSADLSFEQVANLRPRAYEVWAAEARRLRPGEGSGHEVWAAEAERPLYCKAHDAYHLTPSGEPLFPAAATFGAVYVVRDPRAVAVSLAYHFAQPIEQAIRRLDDPAEMLASSTTRLPHHLRQILLRWSDHVESWLAAPFPVHLLRYEDMQTDPHAAFATMAAFLGLPRAHESIAAAVAAASFSRLQAQEREAGFIERPPPSAAFFREGSVDGWRRILTPSQTSRIVASHGAVMRRLGYDTALAPFTAKRGAA